MEIEKLEPFPSQSNPFLHDAYHMGTAVASNVMVMHETFPEQKARYIIIVNTETGERIRVRMGE